MGPLSKSIRICSTDTPSPGWALGPGTAETASVKCHSSYSGLPYWQGCCKYKGGGGWELARATSEEEAGASGELVILSMSGTKYLRTVTKKVCFPSLC